MNLNQRHIAVKKNKETCYEFLDAVRAKDLDLVRALLAENVSELMLAIQDLILGCS